MPKELFEVNQFESGNYYTPDDRDIPDDAAVYSENIDPYGQDGSLRAIHEDASPIMANVDANRMAIINDEGTHRLVFVDRSDGDMMKVDDIYGSPALSELESGSFAGASDIPAMQVNNKEVHIGLGKGSTKNPKWVGVIPNGQFGNSATSGLQIADAELKNPNPFPVMHKVVADENNEYIYGHKLNDNYMYKFDATDGIVDKRSRYYFSSIRSVALASDGNLWVADLVGNDLIIIKIDTDSMDAISSRPLNSFTNDANVTDIEQQGNTLWLAAGDMEHTSDNYFWNISVSNLTTSSSAVSVTNRSPYRGTDDFGSLGQGQWVGVTSTGNVVGITSETDMSMPRLPLIKVTGSNSYMGLFVRPVHSANSAHYLRWYKSSVSTDFIGWDGTTNDANSVKGRIRWFIMIVKDDLTAGETLGDSSDGDVLAFSSAFDETYNDVYQAKQNDGSNKLVITALGNSSSTTSIWQLTKIAYNASNSSTAGGIGRIGAGTSVDVEEGVSSEISGSFNVFSGLNRVRWTGGTSGNLVKKLEGQIAISIANNSLVDGSLQPATNDLFYATSFTYDGYQESPLSDWKRIDKDDFSQDSLNVTLQIFPSELSPRVSHVNLYRSDATGTVARPTEFFRLVQTVSIKSGWGAIDSNTSNPDWGNFYEKSVIDSGASYASYEARTGISQEIRYTLPHYGLSTKINNFLYIADCSHPDIEDASYYLFKSRPFNYDQFNWIRDSLILPEKPTALESFNGRVFVFSESNCYIVNPDGLYIEDTIEGVGCINQNLVKTSDVGLCVMDNNSVYLNVGQGFEDIGARIKSNYQYSTFFQSQTSINKLVQFSSSEYTGERVMAYDYYRKSFYIFFTTEVESLGVTSYKCFTNVFTVPKARWDTWYRYHGSGATTSLIVHGAVNGKKGEVFTSDNESGLVQPFDPHSDTRVNGFLWYSKKFTMGQSTVDKKFFEVGVVSEDGGQITSMVNTVEDDETFATLTTPQTGRDIQIRLQSANDTSSSINSFRIVYRRKRPVRAMT